MPDDFSHLSDLKLPDLPDSFREGIDLRTRPVLRRRRTVRRVRRLSALSLAIAVLAVAWPVVFRDDPVGNATDEVLVAGDEKLGEKWEFDLRAVRDAFPDKAKDEAPTVREAFPDKTLDELLAMRVELKKKQPGWSFSLAGVPLQSVVESSDAMVQGVIEDVRVDEVRLANDLRFSFSSPLIMTVRFRVERSVPPIKEAVISVVVWGELEDVPVGAEMLLGVVREGDGYAPPYLFIQSRYRIGGQPGKRGVGGMVYGVKGLSIDEAWTLIQTIRDSQHGIEPDAARMERYHETLESGSLQAATRTLAILWAMDAESLNGEMLLDALERFRREILEDIPALPNQECPIKHRDSKAAKAYRNFSNLALDLLLDSATEADVDRAVEMYIDDMTDVSARFFDDTTFAREQGIRFLRLAVSAPGPNRRELVLGLMGRPVDYFEQKGMKRPSGGFLVKLGYEELKVLAETPGEDVEAIIEEIFATPEAFGGFPKYVRSPDGFRSGIMAIRRRAEMNWADLGMEERLRIYLKRTAEGESTYFQNIWRLIVQPDPQIQNFLLGKPSAAVIWRKAPDPRFLDVLRRMVPGHSIDHPVLEAIEACGEGEEALSLAQEILDEPFETEDVYELFKQMGHKKAALWFLGRTGDRSIAPLIWGLLEEGWIDECRAAQEQAFSKSEKPNLHSFTSPDRRPFDHELRMAGLLALTKIGDLAVMDEWRKLWREGDAPQRMTAAVALYALGEDDGVEWVEAFRRGEERDLDGMVRHFATKGSNGEFQNVIRYLRSPETDALFLDRIERGIQGYDGNLLLNVGFLHDHAERVLPILVKHISQGDPRSRRSALESLERIFGIKRGGSESEAILSRKERERLAEMWGADVEKFLAYRSAAGF